MASKKQDPIKSEFSPLSIARMLWKKRWVVVTVWVVLLAVTAVVVYKLPAVYTAEATVLVDSQKIPERYVNSSVNTDVGDRLATINQQIMSSSRLMKIIETFDLYKKERKTMTQEEIIEQMRKDISINLVRGWTGGRPGAFKMGYEGPVPSVVAGVANQLANLYVEENLKTRESQAEGTADFLDSQMEESKKKLEELDRQVSEFKHAHSGSLPEQENSLLATVSGMQVRLQGVQDAINRLQENKTMTETALGAAETTEHLLFESVQPKRVGQTPGIGQSATSSVSPARKRSEVAEDMLQQLRLRYNERYPEIQSLKEEVARLKRLEQAEETRPTAPDTTQSASAQDSPKDGPSTAEAAANSGTKPVVLTREILQERERIATLKTQLSNLANELKFQTSEQERLVKLMASYQGRIESLPLVEQQMAALTRDYENSKTNYKSLLEKKLAAGMATDMERRQQAERFTIIDPAQVPEKPTKPNRPLLSAIGAALSIGLGLIVGLALEIRKNAFLGEWELPPDVVVLGRVPLIKMPITEYPWYRSGKAAVASAAALAMAAGTAALYAWGRN
jgi:polysaccharide chain length determinant protein (PEP-CTERM system associated)